MRFKLLLLLLLILSVSGGVGICFVFSTFGTGRGRTTCRKASRVRPAACARTSGVGFPAPCAVVHTTNKHTAGIICRPSHICRNIIKRSIIQTPGRMFLYALQIITIIILFACLFNHRGTFVFFVLLGISARVRQHRRFIIFIFNVRGFFFSYWHRTIKR